MSVPHFLESNELLDGESIKLTAIRINGVVHVLSQGKVFIRDENNKWVVKKTALSPKGWKKFSHNPEILSLFEKIASDIKRDYGLEPYSRGKPLIFAGDFPRDYELQYTIYGVRVLVYIDVPEGTINIRCVNHYDVNPSATINLNDPECFNMACKVIGDLYEKYKLSKKNKQRCINNQLKNEFDKVFNQFGTRGW